MKDARVWPFVDVGAILEFASPAIQAAKVQAAGWVR